MPTYPCPTAAKLSALLLGTTLLLSPISVSAKFNPLDCVPAVSAPSPLSQERQEWLTYRNICSQLTELGFSSQACALLYTRLGPQLAQQLEEKQWSLSQLTLLSLPNCRLEYLDRYQTYALDHPELSPLEAVVQVNLGLDRPFYQDPTLLSDPADPLALVNKYSALPSGYVPELTALKSRYGTGSLTPQAAQAFVQMADAARADGIMLRSVSAYRSYSYQEQLYQRYVAENGQALADTFSARPGHSEHQTGLALDINTASSSAHFEDTPDYAWLQEHCAQYGFVLRYPEGKQEITGYRFEPWHYRYVGVEVAQVCTQLGLTYDEYLAYQAVPGSYALPIGALADSDPDSQEPVFLRS